MKKLVAILLLLATSSFGSTGENIRVLILLLYYAGSSHGSLTPAQAQANFNGTASFYQNASYGQAIITQEAHGWYALPCTRSSCTPEQVDTSALAAAQADGVNTNNFDHRYYLFAGGVPDQMCFGGLACGGGTLTGGEAADSSVTDPATEIHEFGHSIGLNHADIGPIGGGGVYGGDSETLLASQRNQLNWLDAMPIVVSGQYWITSVEQFSGTRAYTIAKSDGTRYIFDYRQSYYGAPVLYIENDSGSGSYTYVMTDPCNGGYGERVGGSYYDIIDRILVTLNSSGITAGVTVTLNSDPPAPCAPTPTPTPTPTATAHGHGHK